MMLNKFICLALCTACTTLICRAQSPEPFVFGEVQTLSSKILKQDRTLNIYLPEGYSSDSAKTYPVIYVLDGSANEDYPHIAGLVQYMNMYDLLPKSLVVGIANVDRSHDFTHPTKVDSDLVRVPNGGGSEPFIRFIEQEVRPFVIAHYKTNGRSTIIGQSLGGLLGMEILFKKPELFDNYILVSPSLWWDNGSLANGADAWTKTNAGLAKHVFLGMAKDDDWMRAQINTVVAAFKANTRPPFKWIFVPFLQETHKTILHRAVYRAFEWLKTGE